VVVDEHDPHAPFFCRCRCLCRCRCRWLCPWL
jgi:hypothetical protein